MMSKQHLIEVEQSVATLSRMKSEQLKARVGRGVWTIQVLVTGILLFASIDFGNNWESELWDGVRIVFATTLFGITQVYCVQYQEPHAGALPGKWYAFIMALVTAAWLSAGLLWVQALGPLKWGFFAEDASQVLDSNSMLWVLSFILSAGAAWAFFYYRFILAKGRYLATFLHLLVLGCIFAFLAATSTAIWVIQRSAESDRSFLLVHALKGLIGLYWLWPTALYLWTFRSHFSLMELITAKKNRSMS